LERFDHLEFYTPLITEPKASLVTAVSAAELKIIVQRRDDGGSQRKMLLLLLNG